MPAKQWKRQQWKANQTAPVDSSPVVPAPVVATAPEPPQQVAGTAGLLRNHPGSIVAADGSIQLNPQGIK